eukprot:GHVP01025399.1.p1 GENE.GHVP01025399.1~~GHVP01025399.1.p1  ORF type:complete len:146 (+),score=25.40 GHVP01025399.1:598-1035(+)
MVIEESQDFGVDKVEKKCKEILSVRKDCDTLVQLINHFERKFELEQEEWLIQQLGPQLWNLVSDGLVNELNTRSFEKLLYTDQMIAFEGDLLELIHERTPLDQMDVPFIHGKDSLKHNTYSPPPDEDNDVKEIHIKKRGFYCLLI